MLAAKAADPFEGMNEVKSQWIKWGKPGDWIRGTLTDVREMESQMSDRAGEMVKVYEFMASGGSFHYFEKINGVVEVQEEPTLLEGGAIWTVGGKPGIDSQMRNVKVGQIFGMRFAEEKPNKNKAFSPNKVIKVLIGEMHLNYMGQTGADQA
jgi:hypothetical protein